MTCTPSTSIGSSSTGPNYTVAWNTSAVADGSYDVRAVMRAICDDDDLLEVRARWAPNLVTAFATIAGRPVGLVGNQPLAIAGTLDIPASQKAARFVAFCDASAPSWCSPTAGPPCRGCA